jgi:hypothetical protein
MYERACDMVVKTIGVKLAGLKEDASAEEEVPMSSSMLPRS